VSICCVCCNKGKAIIKRHQKVKAGNCQECQKGREKWRCVGFPGAKGIANRRQLIKDTSFHSLHLSLHFCFFRLIFAPGEWNKFHANGNGKCKLTSSLMALWAGGVVHSKGCETAGRFQLKVDKNASTSASETVVQRLPHKLTNIFRL